MKDKDGLISRFTFENFVAGHSNKLAYAAANQIAQNPGHAYNPLILYGETGLGKTHLLHSIGHFIRESDLAVNLLCMDGEQFVTRMRKVPKNEACDVLKRKFEPVDVLLFDIVQFLVGNSKKECESAFTEILEYFLQNQKQVVLTSIPYPRGIERMDPNLRRLLGSGRIVCIEPPDFETRVKILRRKALDSNQSMPEDVIDLIASRVTHSVSELEGVQISLFAHARHLNEEINLQFARRILEKITIRNSSNIEDNSRL